VAVLHDDGNDDGSDRSDMKVFRLDRIKKGLLQLLVVDLDLVAALEDST
jgi:hypothetical protein